VLPTRRPAGPADASAIEGEIAKPAYFVVEKGLRRQKDLPDRVWE